MRGLVPKPKSWSWVQRDGNHGIHRVASTQWGPLFDWLPSVLKINPVWGGFLYVNFRQDPLRTIKTTIGADIGTFHLADEHVLNFEIVLSGFIIQFVPGRRQTWTEIANHFSALRWHRVTLRWFAAISSFWTTTELWWSLLLHISQKRICTKERIAKPISRWKWCASAPSCHRSSRKCNWIEPFKWCNDVKRLERDTQRG